MAVSEILTENMHKLGLAQGRKVVEIYLCEKHYKQLVAEFNHMLVRETAIPLNTLAVYCGVPVRETVLTSSFLRLEDYLSFEDVKIIFPIEEETQPADLQVSLLEQLLL